MLKLKKYIILIIGIFAARTELAAERIPIIEAGIFGGASSNSHVVNFSELPGFAKIGHPYESSTGNGISAGLYGEYRLSNLFAFQLRFGYMPLNSELKSREFIGNQEIDGELVHVYSNYMLKPSLSMLTFSPVMIFKPFENFDMFLSFGANLGMFIEHTASYSEYLDDGVYRRGIEYNNGSINQGQTRNAMSGDLYVNKTIYSIVPGIGYKFKLSDKLNIALQADYNYWLTGVYPMKEWELRNSAVTFNMSYTILSEETVNDRIERIEEPQEIDEPPTKQEIIIAKKFPDEKLVSNTPVQKVREDTSPPVSNDCYYIIFATSENLAEINNLIKKYRNAGIEEIRIKEYFDNKDKISYHRLCSRCYTSPDEAISFYDRVSSNQDITKTLSGYFIKLGEINNEK